MFKKKIKNIILGVFGILPIVSLPLLTLFHTNNLNQVNKQYMQNLGTKDLPLPGDASAHEQDYLQDALYLDAYNKAKYDPDSILVYSIFWFGVLHRFGLISHVLTVLKENPDQKIYIMETSGRNNYDVLLEKDASGKRYYPNVHIYFDENFDSSDDTWWMTNRYMTPINFYNTVTEEQNRIATQTGTKPNIHGYFADMIILFTIENYFNGGNIPILKKNLYDYWGHFNNFESFNIFSDGTGTVDFFRKWIYDVFLKADVGKWDNIIGEYPNAVKIRKDLLENKIDVNGFIEKNNSILFLLSLLITRDFNNDNVYPLKDESSGGPKDVRYRDSQFFLGTTQFINDMNQMKDDPSITDGALKTNDGDKFSPYNSVEMDLLSAMLKLQEPNPLFPNQPNKIKELEKIMGLNIDFDQIKNDVETQMTDNQSGTGNLNVIYSGALLKDNDSILNGEVESLKAIYDITKKQNIENKKIKILFKGHPRDQSIEKIRELLIKKINQLYSPEIAKELIESLLIIDPTIPYELYLFSGLFNPDPLKKKEVKLYASFSTITYLLYADGRIDDLEYIIVNNASITSMTYIQSVYGNKSPIFNRTPNGSSNDRLITIEDLKKLANEA